MRGVMTRWPMALIAIAAIAVACTTPPPAHAPGAIAISSGAGHTCALQPGGTIACWGANESGQLGTGTTTNSDRAMPVASVTDATAVAAGYAHTCALKADETVMCWGANESGQLGDGNTTPSLVPVLVSGLTDATAIASGWNHTCAIKADHTAVCWGLGIDGELGNGDFDGSPTPVAVTGLTGVASIEGGQDDTCAVKSDHTAACWGDNGEQGQLGIGDSWDPDFPDSIKDYATPQTVSLTDYQSISAGYKHTCATKTDQTAACWGWNFFGQIGNGSVADTGPIFDPGYNLPQTVVGVTGAVGITAGDSHSCALLATGTAACWGNNESGQVGNGMAFDAITDTNEGFPSAQPVSGLTAAVSISAGENHTCALRSNHQVRCWGDNQYGQLGNGSTTNKDVATPVTGL
jgi:alpha-tubulin suppressor-like RCC1 family protein